MITNETFPGLIKTLTDKEIIEADNDYIVMEAHIFNSGGYATLESIDYVDIDDGSLVVDKDDFLRMLEEFNVLPEYYI